MFACCLHQVLENGLYYWCVQYTAVVCEGRINTSVGRKVLLFSVALDTHLLSVPDLISPQLGRSPFTALEPRGFSVMPWPWHSAQTCLSEIKQRER